MLLPCPYPEPPLCSFNLIECACYARASDMFGRGKFADFIIMCCCCAVRAYTTTDEHGDAGCCDGCRRAARLMALRAASLARAMRGSMWRHRLWVPGFKLTVAVWLGIHRVDGC